MRLILGILCALFVAACSSLPGKQTLPPRLVALDRQLADLDHLAPNLRGSLLYKQLKQSYSKADLQKVSRAGNSMGTLILGFFHKYEDDLEKAADAYLAACEMGNTLGCVNLGSLYDTPLWSGRGTTLEKSDHWKAHKYYRLACDADNAIGCRLLGRQYRRTNLPITNFDTARELYKKSCDLGNVYGCYDLGMFYYKGITVAKDISHAKELFAYACAETGDNASCLMLDAINEK